MQSHQDRFVIYGTSHQVAIVILLAGAIALLCAGRTLRDADPVILSRGLSVAIVLGTGPLQLLYLTPGHLDPHHTLPLQLCDLASMVAAYALWTHRPWATSLTYFWGLTLTPQAVILPSLSHAFPDPRFFLFWTMHVLVIWAAVYLTWGVGLRPTWRTYRTSLAATATWAITVICFNQVADTNYGYLNAKPDRPSALDLLGDWPTYLLSEVVVVATIWALITLPWAKTHEETTGREPPSAQHVRRSR